MDRAWNCVVLLLAEENKGVIETFTNELKKNQHFLPKFYLRFFSVESNKKSIGLYSQKSKIYTLKGEIKHEGSKNFYYDKEGYIEEALEKIETKTATVLQAINKQNELPSFGSIEHKRLLLFVSLTMLRNPVEAKKIIDSESQFYDHIKGRDLDPKLREQMESRLEDKAHAIKMALRHASKARDLMFDLKYGMLLNNTQQPFTTSDNPVVCYNQFLEQKKWFFGGQGFGCRGIQYFIPISPFKLLVFYDPWCYKFGQRKSPKYSTFKIESVDEVNKLNLLQFLNCDSKVYFNELISRNYIKSLLIQARMHEKAHSAKLSQLGSYIIQRQSELKIGYVPSFFYCTKPAKNYNPKQIADIIRPWVATLREISG